MARLTTEQLIVLIVTIIALALLIVLILKLGIISQTNQTMNQTSSVMEELLW